MNASPFQEGSSQPRPTAAGLTAAGLAARLWKGLGVPASIVLTSLLVGCEVSTANVSSVGLGTGVENGKAVNETTTFQPTDHEIHLVVGVSNAPDGTKVTCGWYAVNAGGVTDHKLISTDVTLNGNQSVADCKLTNTSDWASGSYKVALSLNDKLERTMPFDVA
jgi:hypothetical protein